MNHGIIMLFVFLLTQTGCTLKEQFKIKHNDNINTDIQLTINEKIDHLLLSIEDNKCDNFIKNASDALSMLLTDESCKEFEWVHKTLRNASFTILSKTYAKKWLDMSFLTFSGILEKDDYDFVFNQAKKESYITFIEAKLESKSYLITLVHSKINDKWLIDVFNVGEYKLYGKKASDFYALSQKLATEELFIEAYFQIQLCQKLMKPSGDHFRFQFQTEMEHYKLELENKISALQVSIEMSDFTSKPSLDSISLVQTDGEWQPLIMYSTSIELNDTLRIRAENEHVHNFVKTAFPTIFNTGFKKLMYKIENQGFENNIENCFFSITIDL